MEGSPLVKRNRVEELVPRPDIFASSDYQRASRNYGGGGSGVPGIPGGRMPIYSIGDAAEQSFSGSVSTKPSSPTASQAVVTSVNTVQA